MRLPVRRSFIWLPLLFIAPLLRAGQPGDAWFRAPAFTASVELQHAKWNGSGRFAHRDDAGMEFDPATGVRAGIAWAPRSRLFHWELSVTADRSAATVWSASLFGDAGTPNPKVKLGDLSRVTPQLALVIHPFRDERWDAWFALTVQKDLLSLSLDADARARGVTAAALESGIHHGAAGGVNFILGARWAVTASVRWANARGRVDATLQTATMTAPAETSAAVSLGHASLGLGVSARF